MSRDQISSFDPRLTAARPDLAAASLRGFVEAPRFVEGWRRQVLVETVDLRRQPRPDAPVDTQLLMGETVMVFDEDEGWSWLQSERDDYVGYVATHALGNSSATATHRVIVNRTFIYPAADMKQPIVTAVPLDGRLVVAGASAGFSKLLGGGYVFTDHLAPVKQSAPDFVSVAEQLVGAPYLWGGKSVGGIDCSGLVQLAMAVANYPMPRDTDLQEKQGKPIIGEPLATGLQRGDLVFWRGHVGIMTDARHVLHANGHHMLVIRESLDAAQERIKSAAGLTISSACRFDFAD